MDRMRMSAMQMKNVRTLFQVFELNEFCFELHRINAMNLIGSTVTLDEESSQEDDTAFDEFEKTKQRGTNFQYEKHKSAKSELEETDATPKSNRTKNTVLMQPILLQIL